MRYVNYQKQPGPCSDKKLMSILVADYIQKRIGQALLFSFEYNLLPNLISNLNALHGPGIRLLYTAPNCVSFSGTSQLWIEEGPPGSPVLKNKANGLSNVWKNLADVPGTTMFYIESSTGLEVLECNTNDNKVVLEVKDPSHVKAEQHWVKGSPNEEGYFTLESSKKCSKVPKFMTAISASSLQIKGNYPLIARDMFRFHFIVQGVLP